MTSRSNVSIARQTTFTVNLALENFVIELLNRPELKRISFILRS